jgi:hypothetical protein
MDSRPYLFETGDREAEAIRTLVGLQFIAEPFFHELGINPYFCWFVLFAKKHRLLPTAEGDIDILAGPLYRAHSAKMNKCPKRDRTCVDERLVFERSWRLICSDMGSSAR